jgi:large subunit ribosomal protein L17
MRHGKKFNHLGRKSAHRKAMLSNMASSLIIHKRITTTLAKAKALRKFVEPLLTRSKNDSTHSRRVVFSYLENKEALKELFGPISNAIADRPGGYTRILKIGPRKGDNAEMAIIELVDFNELAPGKAEGESSGGGRRRRRRRGGGRKRTPERRKNLADKAAEEAGEEGTGRERTPERRKNLAEKAAGAAAAEDVVEEVVDEVTETVEESTASVVEDAEIVEEVVEEAAAEEEAPAEPEATAEETPAEEEAPAEPAAEEAPAEDAPAETDEEDKKED